jgi:transposase
VAAHVLRQATSPRALVQKPAPCTARVRWLSDCAGGSAAIAAAISEKADPERKAAAARKRRASRDEKLDHLPHEEVVIEPESKVCPCCGGELHVIGEDTSKRLDKVPAKVTVIVTRRPKYACRTCERTGAPRSPASSRRRRPRG